jgi:hypothetical protein
MPDPTTPKYIDGDKVTQQGYAWEERQQDGDYMYALTHHSEPPDPADYDDFDDRDYDDDEEEGGDDPTTAERVAENIAELQQYGDDRDPIASSLFFLEEYRLILEAREGERRETALDYCGVCGDVATETNDDGTYVCDEHWTGRGE